MKGKPWHWMREKVVLWLGHKWPLTPLATDYLLWPYWEQPDIWQDLWNLNKTSKAHTCALLTRWNLSIESECNQSHIFPWCSQRVMLKLYCTYKLSHTNSLLTSVLLILCISCLPWVVWLYRPKQCLCLHVPIYVCV